MSPTVRPFDEKKAKAALKECPKIVRDYVKLLTKHSDGWKGLMHSAIKGHRACLEEQQRLKAEKAP